MYIVSPCIVEEAVQDLPEQDDRHQDDVDAAEDQDPVGQHLRQLLALVDALVLVAEVPLVEGRPRGLEQDQLEVELETSAKQEERVTNYRVPTLKKRY